MDDERQRRIEEEVAKKAEEIAAIEDDFFGGVLGVSQASGQLKESLDKLERLVDRREYEKAAQLGYDDISSEFIFLQRVLGTLSGTCLSKQALVSETVAATGIKPLSYEEVVPFVDAKIESLQPREPRPVEEVDFTLEVDADIVAWFKAQGGDHKERMAKVLSLHYAGHQIAQIKGRHRAGGDGAA